MSYEFTADCHTVQAIYVENDQVKKRHLLREAIKIAKEGLVRSPFPKASHSLPKAMQYLATLEDDPVEKAKLLRDSMPIREAKVQAIDKIFGPFSRARGVHRNYRAMLKTQLARVETDPKSKMDLLRSAEADMRQGIELISSYATTDLFIDAIAEYEEFHGDILLEIHGISDTIEPAQQAIRTYLQSIEHRKKAGLNPAAPTYWKLARTYDEAGDQEAASRIFGIAAEQYRGLATRIPGSTQAFSDLASYMEAWSAIENARIHHGGEEFSKAAEHYGRAAEILKLTRMWSHLSPHYTGCGELERGEALSRQEKAQEAIEAFTIAAKSFDEAGRELESTSKRADMQNEKKELEDWATVTRGRQRYTHGRIKLERAKLLDQQGEKEASSTEYNSASEIFKALAKTAASDQSRRELETLELFSMAWSKMKEAEAKISPELYEEAAQLCLKTERTAVREKMRLLALASFSICKALGLGTLFRRTHDTQLYSEIKKQLETAAEYYEEGEFRNATGWTGATCRLFDALVYMSDAESEKDPRKKTDLFHLAEKHFQLAAKLYGEAGFSKKREEALRHLERARDEKALLLTPLEALSENPHAASPLSPVSLVRDQSLGLEMFEGANVVGSTRVAEKATDVGSALLVELEMANVGKASALLLKLDNLVSEGLELDLARINETVKENKIDLKGRRLDYLKTHEVRIPIKALRKGSFQFRPRVVFVDEKGRHGSYEFEPTILTVRELGISGWVKGPK